MKTIPGGIVTMRDDRVKRVWKVEIQPFLMAVYPVTQELYFSVTGKSTAAFKGDRNPVETVSWYDAISFCNLHSREEGLTELYTIHGDDKQVTFKGRGNGFRLPTEAEWQYACQAGTSKVRYGDIENTSWYKDNSGGKPHEVGLKEPNAWGLHDMLGNVWEWCQDLYDEKVYGSYRIFRGGGWNDPERGCLATNRRRGHPTFKIDDLGFRIARKI